MNRSMFFSLDHPAFAEECGVLRHHVMQQQRHSLGQVQETVRLLHHCDYTMKELSMGVEVNAMSFKCEPANRLRSRMPSYLVELLEPIHTRSSKRSTNRLWFESGPVEFQRSRGTDREEVFFNTPVMQVRSHPLEFDEIAGYIDTVEDAPPECEGSQFARAMSLCMNNLTQYFPEFSWLAELPKMQRVARELRVHQEFMQEKCSDLRAKLPSVLAGVREEIPEWPHAPRTREQILQSLCVQNPHATRQEIEEHHVFHDAVRDASLVARKNDENTIDQLVKALSEIGGPSFNKSEMASQQELRGYVKEWLDTGCYDGLSEGLSRGLIMCAQRFRREVSHLGCFNKGGASFEATPMLVPTAIFYEPELGCHHFVCGGVDLGSSFVEREFQARQRDFWRSCNISASSCEGWRTYGIQKTDWKMAVFQATNSDSCHFWSFSDPLII